MTAREEWLHRLVWLAVVAYYVVGFSVYGLGEAPLWFSLLGVAIGLAVAVSFGRSIGLRA